MTNPLLTDFALPPFSALRPEHVEPAIRELLTRNRAELERMLGTAATWDNVVAPLEMSLVGKSPHAICEQIKDPKRNGGKTLAQIVDHNAHDELVAWGWAPGHGREPAPGTQRQFGDLVAAWVNTGAECPPEGKKPKRLSSPNRSEPL